MELTGAVLRRSALPSAASPVAARVGRRMRRPARVACVGGRGGGFAEEGHLRYYEAAAPRRKAVEAVARDLGKLRAMGLVAGDAAKEKVLEEATDLLLQELSQMKDEEYKIKKVEKEEKAATKALMKQEKDAKKTAITMMKCEEDESSSESSESDCEDEATMNAKQGMMVSTAVPEVVASSISTVSSESDCEDKASMNVEQGMMVSTVVPEVVASSISTVSTSECDKAAMKAMKKIEKEQMKAMKKMEKEQKKAAKKAIKMEKEARKMAMATLNGCRDEDDSSCSSESSESECEGQVVRMNRCATITAPEMPSPSTGLPIIVPQIPAPLAPEPSQPSDPAIAVQATMVSSVAVAETSTTSRIEVCMGGKCKKAGSLALLQEFEKTVGAEGAVVGCKCLGKCGLGPNVRLRSDVSAEGSAKGNRLCIGVGLEDVGTMVTGLFGGADLGMTPT